MISINLFSKFAAYSFLRYIESKIKFKYCFFIYSQSSDVFFIQMQFFSTLLKGNRNLVSSYNFFQRIVAYLFCKHEYVKTGIF